MMRWAALRNLKLGVKDVMLHKARSILTMLGMVFGVGSVIAMLAVGEGASQEAMSEIRKLGSQNIIITSIKPVEEEMATAGGGRLMSIYGILREDEHRIRDTIPYVRRTVPVRLLPAEARIGERLMETRVVGTTHDWFDLVERKLLGGRVLAARDLYSGNAVCVLTEHGARRLLPGRHAVGEYIRFGGHAFQVVGIVRHEGGGGAIQVPDQPTDAYIPLPVLMDRFGDITVHQSTGSRTLELVELHQLLVEVEDIDKVEPVAEAIKSMLARFHDREDYRVSVPLALLRQAEATKRTFNIVLGSIAGISLLVGGIGIMNIMLASVTERTREIGVRRAIGARRRQIISQFLVETMVLSCTGGVIGIGLGLAIPRLVTRFSGMMTVVPLYSLPLAFGISVAIGIVFGLYPAVRAAHLDPIEALRHE